MRARNRIAFGACAYFLSAGLICGQQKVLVLCGNDSCDYHRVSAFLVDGHASVRILAKTTDKVGVAEMKTSREVKIDQVAGLFRDSQSSVFQMLGPDNKPREIAVPSKFTGKEPASPAAAWRGATLEYRDTPTSKTGTAVAGEAFACLLVSPDPEQTAFQLLQSLLDSAEAGPRRRLLIQGALRFLSKSPALQELRDSLLIGMREDLKRFDEQEGDPTTLADALRDAVRLKAKYLQIADGSQSKDLLDQITSSHDLFMRRVTIADVLRKAAYWDEYLLKVKQLGLAVWSVPDFLANLKEASHQSSTLHVQRSQALKDEGHWDRAFDEAALAVSSNSCDPAISEYFYQVRVQLVDHNRIPSSPEYNGANRALLEQIVRELQQLDPSKEQVIRERIRQGETSDPNFLPLQRKKAEFLDLLGKYEEALAVVSKIERDIRLDPKQLDDFLMLDGRITNDLTDAIQKSEEETRRQFVGQRYQAALEAAGKGLRAGPRNAPLLYYSALSAAFLRQHADAIKYVRAYLSDADLLCAPADEPAKMLDLYRLLVARAPRNSSGAIPHWISGMRYSPGEVFYDPVSMGFLQPVLRILAKDGLTTTFQWEDRSFLLRSITTATSHSNGANAPSTTTPLFEAEPKYDRQALSMLEIGSRATSAGERTVHTLTYLNSPGVDPDLVFRFTGKQIARGWAGNPFFHPFIWSGFYVFDLTYDRLGRIFTATPIREEAGSRADPFSEPLQFNWDGDSRRLHSIRGLRTGYLRELHYEKGGRLKSEQITYPKGRGSIDYEYAGTGPQLRSAKCEDNFYDKRERFVSFDPVVKP